MFDSTDSAGTDAPPAMTRAERRMLKLERMGDIGLAIAEKLGREAERAAVLAESELVPDNLPHAQNLRDIAKAYGQVSRAVAICCAMEDRIDKGLPALPDVDRTRRLREQALEEKREAVRRGVVNAIEADPTITSARRRLDLRLRLDGFLDREVRDLDRFLDRPFPELVERLRVNLGLEPDEAAAQASPLNSVVPDVALAERGDPGPSRANLTAAGYGRGIQDKSLRRGLRSRTGDRSRAPP